MLVGSLPSASKAKSEFTKNLMFACKPCSAGQCQLSTWLTIQACQRWGTKQKTGVPVKIKLNAGGRHSDGTELDEEKHHKPRCLCINIDFHVLFLKFLIHFTEI